MRVQSNDDHVCMDEGCVCACVHVCVHTCTFTCTYTRMLVLN